MEEARKLVRELEALKQQVLSQYPEAEDGDGEGLPGQVVDSDKPPPSAARDEPHRTLLPGGEADQKSAVVDMVQAELAKRMDTLRNQVWREIVREELESMGTVDPAKSEIQSGDVTQPAGESEGTTFGTTVTRGRERHSGVGPIFQVSHHAEHARQHHQDHHHKGLHHEGVYNADYVLGPMDGYKTGRSRSGAQSTSGTPRDTAHQAGSADGETGPESNGHAPEGEDTDAGDSKPKADPDDDDEEDDDWVSVSENAYGAFIHVGLQSGFKQAVVKCWTMLLVSIVIAVIFSFELIQRHEFFSYRSTNKEGTFWLDERPHICWIPYKLQTAASMIFITLIFNNISGMVQAGRIALQSTHHKFGDGENVGEMLDDGEERDADEARPLKVPFHTRIGIFIFAVLTEVITWFMILASGLLFIFTSNTVDLVIRSTVAVMFVLNVDEIVFESCCPGSIKEDVEETKYRIVNPKMSNTTKDLLEHYFGLYIYLPLLLAMSSGIVVLGRNLLECEQSPFWQVPAEVSGVVI